MSSPSRTLIKSFVFKSIPQPGPLVAGKHFRIEEKDTAVEDIKLAENEVLFKGLYFSLDPIQRSQMRPTSIKSILPAFEVDQPIMGSAIIKVVESKNPQFDIGGVYKGFAPFESYSVLNPERFLPGLRKVENPHAFPESYFLGVFGVNGMVAYTGFYEVGKPKKGETILVSAAAGASGTVVGQLAKLEGLKVIGSVGSDEKVKFLTEKLGFDHAFNYKTTPISEALANLAPEGLDLYYDTIGGKALEDTLPHMKFEGRVLPGGAISQYGKPPSERFAYKNLAAVMEKSLRMEGFTAFNPKFAHVPRASEDKIAPLIKEGRFVVEEQVNDFEDAAEALVGLYEGRNTGKTILKV